MPVDPEDGPAPRPPRIVLLAVAGTSTNVVYHALDAAFGGVSVVLEQPVSRWQLARRRAKRLGPTTVAGQILFVATVVPLLTRSHRTRVEEIVAASGLEVSPVPGASRVESVNSENCRAVLRELRPDVVVVNGTRIISPDTLACVPAPFVNMHAGITPQYRGTHGGYWALAEGRPDLVGTTVHLVDRGIDTGPILGQASFAVTERDSFVTYPYLHTAAGLPLLTEAVRQVLDGTIAPRPPLSDVDPSCLRFHPTLWGYLSLRLRRSVR